MSIFFGKRASFRFLWFGQMFANLGDILYVVCLIKLIFDATGSVTYMSLVPFFTTISALISGILAPLVINKYKLKSILVYSQSGKTLLLFVLCLFALHFESDGLFWIYVLICFISFLDGWASPARNALVPSMVEESKLVQINSILSISDQIVQLIAWPFGSILLVAMGAGKILWLTFSLYLLATVCMWLIKHVANHQTIEEQTRMESLKEGWRIIWHSKQLRTISFMNILETFANGVWIAAILFVFVAEALNKGEGWWGFINGSFFAGMLFGGLLIYRFSVLIEKNLGKTILWSTFCLISITFLFGTTSIPWFALLVSFIFGMPQMARDVAETTIIQRSAKEQLLAKVYSARGTLIFAAFGISSLVMGWITETFGVRITFLVATGLFLCSFTVALMGRKYLFLHVGEKID
ncbi:MFS transporter [Neobacillus sp. MM2021_6]|uniref:MFS transporter n=1 Tax=Bacillaceae TaxID=186817 RepID=UPI00140E89A8|nr:MULTISPECIES: MFS transporter [Bacillaceae]MBO0962070.1 MFS transporter [Neobacillus sp. MM2021_6]NHC19977.1 MFS transporter [Bacillus sp. MM2020_4]